MNLMKALSTLSASMLLAVAACGEDTNGNGNPDGGSNGGMDMGTDPVLTGIEVTPATVSIEVGGAPRQLTVTGSFDDGSSSNLTSMAMFMSSDAAVAPVSSTGLVSAGSEGMATITVTVDTFTDTVSVTITGEMTTEPLTIPMTVDANFPDRSAFFDDAGGATAPLHTEDDQCPMRAGAMNGTCHRFTWDGTGGAFTGTFWTVGEAFTNLMPREIETGANEVTFWAWGANGGEQIVFGAGLGDAQWDGAEARATITLTDQPAQYSVSLADLGDPDEIYGAFVFAADNTLNPNGVEIYVDDIQWITGNPPAPIELPMVVDANFPDRSAFGEGGAPLHTETTDTCPMRAGDEAGLCHTLTWDGTGGGFTGAFWTVGEAFTNLQSKAVAGGATEVTFWAWGAAGGEQIVFGAGLGDAQWDGIEDRATITLSNIPTRYSVPLTNFAGYTDVYSPFIWSADNTLNPNGFTFYVDDIKWQVGEPAGDDLVIFGDNFGNGISFAAFGGSTNDLAPDPTMPQEGSAALRVVVPAAGYTGGALKADADRDLSAFNALTFWARADADNAMDVAGVGNDGTNSNLQVELTQLALTSTWQQFVVPIPDPSILTAEDGLFHFAEGAGDYTIWFDDIRLTNLDTITNPRPSFATENITREVGATFSPNGMTVIYDVGGTDVQVFPRPPYFDWMSSNMSVATIDANGLGTAVAEGTAEISGMLGATMAPGLLTVEVIAAQLPATAAPTPPARDPGDVISLFSDAYTNITVDTFSAVWDSADVDDQTVAGDNVKRYRNHRFAGIEFFNDVVDATDMTHVHVDMWTPGATQFRVRLVDFAPGGTTESTVLFDGSTTPSVVTGQWISFDIPLSDFTTLGGRANISQILLLTDEAVDDTIVIDNLYFYR